MRTYAYNLTIGSVINHYYWLLNVAETFRYFKILYRCRARGELEESIAYRRWAMKTKGPHLGFKARTDITRTGARSDPQKVLQMNVIKSIECNLWRTTLRSFDWLRCKTSYRLQCILKLYTIRVKTWRIYVIPQVFFL